MTMETKNDLFDRYKKEYFGAEKERKSVILDIVCDAVGMHRKAAIRKFRALQVKDVTIPERRGRRLYYDKAVEAALRDIWGAAGEICGTLLHPIIGEYIAVLLRDGMWEHGDLATGKLRAMSLATTKRRVRAFLKVRRRGHGISGTSPSRLKQIIPIRSGDWEHAKPGEEQIDTVAHCGHTLLGDFVWSLNCTDVATGWTTPRAQWNKGQEATRGNFAVCHDRLPWPMIEAHPDTGSEFINYHFHGWCAQENIRMTRSRPGKKNDNCHVEERNGHVIRKFVGYTRLDAPETVDALNAAYEKLALYLNHFVPTRRTKAKERMGAKYRRTYETPMTPYARAMAHPDIAEAVKARLRREHEALNPLVLKKEVDRLFVIVFDIQKRRGDPTNSGESR